MWTGMQLGAVCLFCSLMVSKCLFCIHQRNNMQWEHSSKNAAAICTTYKMSGASMLLPLLLHYHLQLTTTPAAASVSCYSCGGVPDGADPRELTRDWCPLRLCRESSSCWKRRTSKEGGRRDIRGGGEGGGALNTCSRTRGL